MRVIKSYEARVAVELFNDGEADAQLLMYNTEGGFVGIDVCAWPQVWNELLEDKATGNRIVRKFGQWWMPCFDKGGVDYPPLKAVRSFLTPGLGVANKFSDRAFDAVISILPSGDFHLFTADGFGGRFLTREDAVAIGKAMRVKSVVVGSPDDLKTLMTSELNVVLSALDPEREWNVKPTKRFFTEVFSMAKAAKKKAKAAATTSAKGGGKKVGVARPDGPVAKARAIFEKMRGKETKEIKAACDAAKINPGTTSVQLGKWRKENGIVVARAKPKTKPAKPKAKAASKKKAADIAIALAPEKDPATPLPATPPKGGGKVVKAKKKTAKAAKPENDGGPVHTDLTPEPEQTGASTLEEGVSTERTAGEDPEEDPPADL